MNTETIKLYGRDKVLYAEYYEYGSRKRKSLSMPYSKTNVAYARKHIIPNMMLKLREKGTLRQSSDLLVEYVDEILARARINNKPSTIRNYVFSAGLIKEYFKNRDMKDLTAYDIENYITHLKIKNYSSATIHVCLAPITLAFSMAIKKGVVQVNPVKHADKPSVVNEIKDVPNVLVIKRMMDESSGYLKRYIYLAVMTGLRPSEILGLRWEDLSDNSIRVVRAIKAGVIGLPKTNRTWELPLMPSLKAFLDKEDKDHPYIINTRGKHLYDSSTVNASLKRFVKTKDIPFSGSPKTFRHFFTSMMIQSKENPKLIQKFLGHSSMDMINRVYSHYIESESDMDAFQKKLVHTDTVDEIEAGKAQDVGLQTAIKR